MFMLYVYSANERFQVCWNHIIFLPGAFLEVSTSISKMLGISCLMQCYTNMKDFLSVITTTSIKKINGTGHAGNKRRKGGIRRRHRWRPRVHQPSLGYSLVGMSGNNLLKLRGNFKTTICCRNALSHLLSELCEDVLAMCLIQVMLVRLNCTHL